MKYLRLMVLLFCTIFCSCEHLEKMGNSTKFSYSYNAKVIKVIDGDTIKIKVFDKIINLSLYGVDAPEIGQEFSFKSRNYLQGLVYNKEIIVEPVEIENNKKDLIAKIYFIKENSDSDLEKGEYINKKIIYNGYAWHDQKIARYDKKLRNAQQHAQHNNFGLWDSKTIPIKPEIFRQEYNQKL
ncbi:thermonuclease family protein [Lentisphaerota bacterium WC36G]|nr:thermonuclease family protein [Lentisphaerae bacterium WC36]